MDTSYFFPNFSQLGAGAGIGQGLAESSALQDQPLNYELLRQQVLGGQLQLAGEQQGYAFKQAILGHALQNLNNPANETALQGSQPQPNAPQQNPSATGGGGSSGGSVGSNPGQEAMTSRPSPTNTMDGSAPSSQGAGGNFGIHDPFNVLGMGPDVQAAIAIADPQMAKSMQEARDSQIKAAQFHAQGPINGLESFRNTASPAQSLMANPNGTYMATWRAIAPQLGINPNDPSQMTDANVRQVLGIAANQIRGQVGLPAQKYEHYTTLPTGPAGEVRQVDTEGKISQVQGPEVKPVLGPNNLPVNVAPDQAVGRTPFMAPLYGIYPGAPGAAGPAAGAGAAGAAGAAPTKGYDGSPVMPNATKAPPVPGQASLAETTAWRVSHYQQAPPNTRSAFGQQVATLASQYNPDYNEANYDGVKKTITDYTGGQTHKTILGLNTALEHMSNLSDAAQALGNNDVQGLNRLSNFFQTQFGGSAANNFNIVRDFAAGEVAKAVLPGGGGEQERQEIAKQISAAGSPQQLAQGIDKWRTLLAGKNIALKQAWDTGTQGVAGDYDRFLTPRAKAAFGAESGGGQGGNTSANTSANAPAGAPQEGAKSTSKSGKPIVFANGHWQYQ